MLQGSVDIVVGSTEFTADCVLCIFGCYCTIQIVL